MLLLCLVANPILICGGPPHLKDPKVFATISPLREVAFRNVGRVHLHSIADALKTSFVHLGPISASYPGDHGPPHWLYSRQTSSSYTKGLGDDMAIDNVATSWREESSGY